MKELRQTALAYYRDASIQIQLWANEVFAQMDEDGNEKVSLQEYLAYMEMHDDCKHLSTPRFFDELKQEGSEELEFMDVLTLIYIVYSGRPFCNGHCKNFIKGGYFTCVKCFDDHSTKDTFDVCSVCYVDGKYVHGHGQNNFLDNFLLLQTKRGMGAKLNQHQEASRTVSQLKTLDSGSGGTPVEPGNSPSSCSCSSYSTSAETSKSSSSPSSSSSGTLAPGPSSSSTTSNAVVPVNPRPNNRGRKALKTIEMLLALGNIFVASTQCTIM